MATRIASIVVAGTSSIAPWVDYFVVECYSDSGLTQLVGVQSSKVNWDAASNSWSQHDTILFSGLTYGQTYYLRHGVVSPVNSVTTWSSTFSQVAGVDTAPTPTYSPVLKVTHYGIQAVVTPSNVPSNIDHYEGVWNLTNTTPASTDMANWRGNIDTGQVYFTVPVNTAPATPVYVWVRAVNTSHIQGPWVKVINGTVAAVIDPTGDGFISKGSLPPGFSGAFSYTNTTTTLTWTPPSFFFKDDNTVISSWSPSSITITGLPVGTGHAFYPYLDENTGIYQFSTTALTSTPQGSPACAYNPTIGSPAPGDRGGAIEQATKPHLPLANGNINAPTAASGTGGGSGGGDGGCLHHTMLVETLEHGVIPCLNVSIGDHVKSRSGYCEVTAVEMRRATTFLRFELSQEAIEVTPRHILTVIGEADEEESKVAMKVSFTDVFITDTGIDYIKVFSVVNDPNGYLVGIECDTHEFYSGITSPTVLVHNFYASRT